MSDPQENPTRLIFTSIEFPVKAYLPWPIEDDTLDVIDIGHGVAMLPRAEPRLDLDDGFVTFMQEAWRCLAPGGLLTIRAPRASHGNAVSNPENVRYFNEDSFMWFGVPKDKPEMKCKGKDRYGTNFWILNCPEDPGEIVCSMEKPERD